MGSPPRPKPAIAPDVEAANDRKKKHRELLAATILAGMLASPDHPTPQYNVASETPYLACARDALKYADALIEYSEKETKR